MRHRILLMVFLCVGIGKAQAQLFGGQIKRAKGTVSALVCGSVVNSGSLYAGSTATAATSFVPFTGGNGGFFVGQTVASTGVTGLTATASQQNLAMGSGYVTYNITGIPSAAGTASFAISVGGQSCTFTLTVLPTSAQYPSGSVFCASGASAVVDVTNSTTGKTWMDRNLGASQVATSPTDAAAYGDLYQWGRRSDGHQCRTSVTTTTLSSVDQPNNGNFIIAPLAPNDWRNPQNSNLWQGINGVNNPCPSGFRVPTDSELETERISWSANTFTGAFNSPLKLPVPGGRQATTGAIIGVGTVGNYWSSSISGSNASSLNFASNYANMGPNSRAGATSVRCIKETVATIGSLNCGGMTLVGNLLSGQSATGVSITVPYTGGNGGYYTAQTIPSTGVTGLTATLSSGFVASGLGNLVYTVSGTPSGVGMANFAINVGGQICSFSVNVQSLVSQYPAGSVFCASGATAIVDVTNPTTGKTWMDRNLGATQVATSETDAAAYGDLYQWGRRSDGHQCRTSSITSILSSIDQPLHGNFIVSNQDWRSPQNANLWQGVNGVNNPCPSGYRLPTTNELENERLSWTTNSSSGALSSPLKWTLAGKRNNTNAALALVGGTGHYWGSGVSSAFSRILFFTSNAADLNSEERSSGFSVRCIKETVATVGALNCGGSNQTGNVYSGLATSGVSVTLPYTGGNGGFQTTQTYSSTGVTGLTATLSSGLIAAGAGNFLFTIAGTPSTAGTANFVVSIGGQSCTMTILVGASLAAQYPAGSLFCISGPTAIVDVTNPTTGKTWMDRNLGATQAATSSTDAASYGDLYQWGRGGDGHQCRTSSTTTTLSSTIQPGNANFILTTPTGDWLTTPNGSLWQGVNGINNPCPSGYRLPTQSEFNAEVLTWSANSISGAFGSSLKLPAAGGRLRNIGQGGSIVSTGTGGVYWTSTVNVNTSININFGTLDTELISPNVERSDGMSIRCIKN